MKVSFVSKTTDHRKKKSSKFEVGLGGWAGSRFVPVVVFSGLRERTENVEK